MFDRFKEMTVGFLPSPLARDGCRTFSPVVGTVLAVCAEFQRVVARAAPESGDHTVREFHMTAGITTHARHITVCVV